ncbi:MAG TPA: serine/threonine-protein kinase [Urbifossiella sp.]|nr:serine/threonine-protein kinase [Urbifossiella sp.]
MIASAESLVEALRDSGLFPPAEVDALARELVPFADDMTGALRHVVEHELVPVYQLRKIIHAKTADLIVGPFVVLDKLGEGGMGKVFKARDTRTGRIAAIKVIRPHLLTNPVIRGRYEREVRAALSLRHPHIAAAFEAGEVGGKVYLALEFVDGIDLARLVRTFGVLPVPEACEYLRQAALGLAHAHSKGFIHRDIKPGNLVVAGERHHPDATEPAVVKLLDMGLVRTVGFDDEGGGDLTRAGTVVGTPDYMAPEQAKNSSLADHRADLYALGGAFYFLLTGKPPFHVGSPIEKILKHQVDPPPPLQAIRPDVPDELAKLVARLLAKRPENRPGSAADVAELLLPLTKFTADSASVQLSGTHPTLIARDGAETGSVAAVDTVSPNVPDSGVKLPRRRPRNVPMDEPSVAESADPPTPPTPVEVSVPVEEEEAPPAEWRGWAVALMSGVIGVVLGVAAWKALGR